MNQQELRKLITYGFFFLVAGLIINYIYRMVFNTIPIEKLIVDSDMEGYYQYLPHFFIRDWSTFDNMRWTIPFGDGKTLSVFTCGVAILWLPFFLFAHICSLLFGLDSDGYADMYYWMMLTAGIVYTYLGLVFIYKILREYFENKVSLVTVALLFLATNIFFYSFLIGACMSHVYSFSLITIYIYYCHQFSKSGSMKSLLLLGFSFALAVLIRPTNILFGLYLLLYGVNDLAALKERFNFWKSNFRLIIILCAIGVITFIPQMLYWHHVTGKFIYYSYQDYGFTNWLTPKFGIVLFGKYNGWLTYTPIVLFGLVGLFIQLIKKQMNSLAVVIILLLSIYVNASWWMPTFSAAAGQRAMIDLLPFLAIPLAFVMNYINGISKILKVAAGVIIIVFVFYNIRFCFNYYSGTWWDSPMNWDKFWNTLKF